MSRSGKRVKGSCSQCGDKTHRVYRIESSQLCANCMNQLTVPKLVRKQKATKP